LKTKVGLTFRYSPAVRYCASSSPTLHRDAVHLHGYEQNSQWLDPVNPLRQVDPDADQSILQVSSLEGYGAPIIDLAHLFVGGNLSRVVGTMRNFNPERMSARRPDDAMNIDVGIFLGEFENGALCSVQNQLRHRRQLSGHRSAGLCSAGSAHLPSRRGGRHLRGRCARRRPTRSSSRAGDTGALLSAGRQPAGIVAHALLRQPDQQLHRRDPERRRDQRRGFRRRRWCRK